MKAVERAVIPPANQVAVHRAARWQIRGDRLPLAASTQNAIDDFADVDVPLVPARPGRWDQWLDQGPFVVRQIARIPRLAAVIAATVVSSPRPQAPCESRRRHGITSDS